MTEAAKKPHAESFGRDKVVQIISSVISKVEQAGEVSREAIYKELKQLQDIIEEARQELGQSSPKEINDTHIPTATDELDAVVAATAEATGTIMDSCDLIQEVAGKVGGPDGDALMAETMKIYEACSFQDITGQRITKVVSTLKTIEAKVSALLGVLGSKLPGMEDGISATKAEAPTGDAALLNGPQMPDKAITQSDIDKLLEEFD